jgi:hypothetical protein
LKDNYDFSKGVKNPYADMLKQGYTVTVHYDFTEKEKREDDAGSEKKTGGSESHMQQA